ncbi:MAG: radical SAM protein [Actinobacteria bacterium]|nr:radical SAM protein [Actinomycetota bacterium]MBU1943387.1 radical SAM protein [Actinomycetota bacterium]MBU2686744.1 radical SAM protein [Actinomycetota bacterium]
MLDRYFAIEKKERFAVHWVTRSVASPCPDPVSGGEEELVRANALGLERVRGLKDRPASTALEPAEPSLLDVKVELARRMLTHCHFCERRCGVDRTADETGFCGVGAESRYSSDFLHLGEEPELVPSHTIFFSGCTFECVYCQNWDIAMHPDSGFHAEPEMLSAVLLEGISQGSRNANFVGGNPDPNLHTILETVRLVGYHGRFLPIVWNSNMYTSEEAMDVLEGVIDVYLGDFRYGNDGCARELSGVERYFEVVSGSFERAWKSAEVMVRHLVLPGHLECCTHPIMEWVSKRMPGAYFNLMFQYRPEYRAGLHPEIDRRLTQEERNRALALAAEYSINYQ